MQTSDILNSWKEISNYIGRGVRTVQRWEKDFGLPVRRPGGRLRGSVFAMREDIDAWLSSRQAREADEGAMSEVVPSAAHEHFVRLHKNAKTLVERFARFRRGASELEGTLRRTSAIHDKITSRKKDKLVPTGS